MSNSFIRKNKTNQKKKRYRGNQDRFIEFSLQLVGEKKKHMYRTAIFIFIVCSLLKRKTYTRKKN